MAKTDLTIPNPGAMSSEINVIMSEKDALVAATMAIVVVDEDSKIQATEMLAANLVPLRKRLEDKRKQYSTTLRRLANAWDEEFVKPPLVIVDGLIDHLKYGLGKYYDQQEEKAHKLQEELDRQAKEQEEARLKAVAEAEAAGEPVKEPQIPETISAVAPEVQQTTKTDSGSATAKRTPELYIFDPALLPREYLVPDEVKILDALKQELKVPGAKIVYITGISVRPQK